MYVVCFIMFTNMMENIEKLIFRDICNITLLYSSKCHIIIYNVCSYGGDVYELAYPKGDSLERILAYGKNA